jgi:hypothetical protein
MSKSLSPLRTTTPDLHRFYVSITTTEQWYAVMRECRVWFGTEWRTQPKIRRQLAREFDRPVKVWFDVPNSEWATWIATKLSLEICSNAKFNNKNHDNKF